MRMRFTAVAISAAMVWLKVWSSRKRRVCSNNCSKNSSFSSNCTRATAVQMLVRPCAVKCCAGSSKALDSDRINTVKKMLSLGVRAAKDRINMQRSWAEKPRAPSFSNRERTSALSPMSSSGTRLSTVMKLQDIRARSRASICDCCDTASRAMSPHRTLSPTCNLPKAHADTDTSPGFIDGIFASTIGSRRHTVAEEPKTA
mmetsp:Transcript_7021/g.17340  ORF Transcript_7021/g.17340 Transcript_7021/m.17340 type:complete len:201 (+) Transcript_7021:548-1150(+)